MSPRFAVPVLAILIVSLVPVVRHQYIGALADDGRRTGRLPMILAGLTPRVTSPGGLPGIEEAFAAEDWAERRLIGRDGHEIVLLAVRSYDAKRLYHHPELAILHGLDLRNAGVRYSPSFPSLPLHALAGESGGVAAYALVQGTSFVADPVSFQLRSAARLVFAAREPMALFFAYDAESAPGSPIESSAVAAVVADAARQYIAQRPNEGS